jgi:hypothetical protein
MEGWLTQPASAITEIPAARIMARMIESGLWIILLEAAVALGLLLFIVWWTLPKKRRKPEDGAKR